MKFFETFHWFFNRREKEHWTGNIVLWTILFFLPFSSFILSTAHISIYPIHTSAGFCIMKEIWHKKHTTHFSTHWISLFLFYHPISNHSHYFHSNISFLFSETRNNSHWSLFFVTSFTNSYSISTFKSINTSISPLTCIFTPLFRIKNEKW